MQPISNNVWEEIHASRAWGKYPNEELVRFIGRNYFKLNKEDRKNIRILELGVGQGANVWFLMRESFDVYGIDISPSALKKCKHFLEEDGFSFENFSEKFKQGDIRQLPFSNDCFDVVIDVATAWCLPYSDHSKIYSEVKRVLKSGGKFFSWHLLKDSWGYGKENLVDKDTVGNVKEGLFANQGTTYFADHKDLFNLISEAGLKIVSQEYLIKSLQNMEKEVKHSIMVAVKDEDSN